MLHQHHPIFEKFQPFSGLVPSGHECDFLGTVIRPQFLARKGSGEMVPVTAPYPYPDDEYFEWIDLLESVVLAGPEYTMIELGAGVGRWAVRGAFACLHKQKKYRLVAVEAEPNHFQWMRANFQENGLDTAACTLLHAAVTESPGEFPFYIEAPYGGPPDAWYGQFIAPASDEVEEVESRQYMGLPVRRHKSGCRSVGVKGITLETLLEGCNLADLLDLDIQGHELAVIGAAITSLDQKAKRLHIGTHSAEVEEGIRRLLKNHGWSCTADYPGGSTCDTPWGIMDFQDGVQSWVNVRFVSECATLP